MFIYANVEDPNNSPVYIWKGMIPWDVFSWLGDIWHVVIFTLLCYNSNESASLWEIEIDFKYIIFDEEMILEVNF